MSNDHPISRRDALIAATVLGAVAAVGKAESDRPGFGFTAERNIPRTQREAASEDLSTEKHNGE